MLNEVRLGIMRVRFDGLKFDEKLKSLDLRDENETRIQEMYQRGFLATIAGPRVVHLLCWDEL
jgi:hypothetical protein